VHRASRQQIEAADLADTELSRRRTGVTRATLRPVSAPEAVGQSPRSAVTAVRPLGSFRLRVAGWC